MANIRKLSSGKYQVRVHKDGKLVSIGTFRTSREAEIAAGKAEERKDLGQNITNKNTPFEFVVEEWLKWKK
ncbi:hypothetical protein QNH32_18500 [Priestia flexa]|nr:hypothetical protein [Priestia flexa]WHX78852.1 hypothetical protein QNH32_18500 [Priestia flexa]